MKVLFSSGCYCSVGATAEKNDELTISEALSDPLIAIVMRADGVISEEFKRLLETAARELEVNLANSVSGGGKDTRHVCRNDAEDG
ncbi:hypothetical protein [Rhizobium sullae]|uniref:Uncharacterized protein n=1 Tax=Rhizobium sullae TaxID=50338 RepID=A0ABY5XSD2_RHISU|nr:hypothetical protein [Rhizobium sullae]UWU17549.1 hypothetical protein N2599_33000 [Rhizobium sullae]